MIIVWLAAAIPQPAEATTRCSSLPTDTTKVDVRLPSQEKLTQYANDEAFDYLQETPEPESLISQMLGWIASLLGELFANETTGDIIIIIAYLLFVSMLILIVNQYMKGNLSSMMTRNKTRNGLEMSVEDEHLSSKKLENRIQQAIEENHFREAVCLMYRRSLRCLSEQGYITWQKDKTNQDYVYELDSENLRSLFRDVTHFYEYAEYGHFPVDRQLFNTVREHFEKLNNLIYGNR